MSSERRLKIIVDQEGNAATGIKSLAGGLGGLTSLVGPVGLGVTAVTGVITTLGGAGLATGAKLIDLGSDAAEMESKFNTVFGTFARGTRTSLEQFGDEVGRSTYELEEMASALGDTFVPLGFTRSEAASLSVQMTKLATDVASFNNEQDTTVMESFQSALVGNHETVRKYGIIITQATLDQELMRMGIEDGIKTATEQEKVQARMNLILAGTTDAQGDAARTAGGWANQMRGLKATISEGATAMGSELLPVVLPLLQNFVTWVKDIMPSAVEIFKEFAKNLGETVGPAMAMIQDAVKRIAEAFGVNTDEVSGTDVVLGAFKTTLDVVVAGIKAAAIVIYAISKAIEGLSNAIGWVIDKWNEMKRAAQDAINAIPDWLRPGSPTPFEMGLRGIGSALSAVGDNMGDAFGGGGSPVAKATSGGGAPVVVNLTYAPAVSLGSKYEAETVLAPYIANALRKSGVRA